MIKEKFFDLLTEKFATLQTVCANDVMNFADELFYKELKEKVQSKGGELFYNQEERPVVLAGCFEEIAEIEVIMIMMDNNNNLKIEGIAKNDGASYWFSQDDLCPGEFRHLI